MTVPPGAGLSAPRSPRLIPYLLIPYPDEDAC